MYPSLAGRIDTRVMGRCEILRAEVSMAYFADSGGTSGPAAHAAKVSRWTSLMRPQPETLTLLVQAAPEVVLPMKAHPGDAALDLYANESVNY